MSAQLASITTYRRMCDSDVDTIVSIESTVHVYPWTRGNFIDSMAAGYHCWVAEHASRLAGYGIVMIAAGEAHLLNLTVAPELQRRGIGGELTRFVLRLAADYGSATVFLEVRPSNIAARALYARMGFIEIGMRRDYYPAGDAREDAIVMERAL